MRLVLVALTNFFWASVERSRDLLRTRKAYSDAMANVIVLRDYRRPEWVGLGGDVHIPFMCEPMVCHPVFSGHRAEAKLEKNRIVEGESNVHQLNAYARSNFRKG